MTRPISDKAEVAVDYPDKFYIGTFERSARFEAHLDQTGVSLSLHRTGDADTRKTVRMHFHYALFADILRDLANTVSAMPSDDVAHRDALRASAEALYCSLGGGTADPKGQAGENEVQASRRGDKQDVSELTPHEEVLLLHVLE